MMHTARLAALAVLMLSSVMASAADTVESVEKRVAAQWDKHKSVTAKFTLKQEMSMSGMEMKTSGEGHYEYVKADDGTRFRVEMNNTSSQSMGGQSMTVESSMLMIDDGEFLYTYINQSTTGQQMAMKDKSDPTLVGGGGKALFAQLRRSYDLTVLPDETVDGSPCFVVQGTPKEEGVAPVAKTLSYFDKERGLVLKIAGFDASGKVVQLMEYKDIKINPKISADRFVFKAPEGVEVVDKTAGPPGSMPPPAVEPSAEKEAQPAEQKP